MPCFNELATIDECVRKVLLSEYVGELAGAKYVVPFHTIEVTSTAVGLNN